MVPVFAITDIGDRLDLHQQVRQDKANLYTIAGGRFDWEEFTIHVVHRVVVNPAFDEDGVEDDICHRAPTCFNYVFDQVQGVAGLTFYVADMNDVTLGVDRPGASGKHEIRGGGSRNKRRNWQHCTRRVYYFPGHYLTFQ